MTTIISNDVLRSLVRKLAAELEDATSFMETMEEYAEEHEHNADDEWIRKASKNNLVKIAERTLNGEVVEEIRCAACLNKLPENTKPYEDTEEYFCSQNCLETLYEDAIEDYYDKKSMTFNEYLQTEGFEDAEDVINREGPAQLEIYSDRYEQQCKECNEIANYN
ncbi:hypothetical protein ACS2BX_26045 [Bacillus cereus group sp. BceL300]|uniref:hypothetical protein n=1 Tax=Bacillus cereus group sp. BceL300 TaxID=3444985 RepID=UPI003F1F1A26